MEYFTFCMSQIIDSLNNSNNGMLTTLKIGPTILVDNLWLWSRNIWTSWSSRLYILGTNIHSLLTGMTGSTAALRRCRAHGNTKYSNLLHFCITLSEHHQEVYWSLKLPLSTTQQLGKSVLICCKMLFCLIYTQVHFNLVSDTRSLLSELYSSNCCKLI